MSGRIRLFFAAALWSTLVVNGASAGDLVSNGDFSSGISAWRLVGRGSLSHSTDGSGAPGALEIDGGLAGNSTQSVAGQCLSPVTPGQTLNFGATVKVVDGTPSYCRVALFESEGADCLWITLASEVRRAAFSGGWDVLSGGVLTVGAGTGSLELRLHCANADGQTGALRARFDDVVVSTTPTADEIFSDGFEDGNTSAWSLAVP